MSLKISVYTYIDGGGHASGEGQDNVKGHTNADKYTHLLMPEHVLVHMGILMWMTRRWRGRIDTADTAMHKTHKCTGTCNR
jgi:hypothetical protein